METQELILEELKSIKKVLVGQAEIMQKLYLTFSKYDDQYLSEMEKEGLNLRP